jgi:hypothetical protein
MSIPTPKLAIMIIVFLVSVNLSNPQCDSIMSMLQLFISASARFNINKNPNFGFILVIYCGESLFVIISSYDIWRYFSLQTWAPEKYNFFMDSWWKHWANCLSGGRGPRFCALELVQDGTRPCQS